MSKQQFKEQEAVVYQAVQGGVVVFEDASRSIVNGYMIRNNITGRPSETTKPHSEVYPGLAVIKEGNNVRVIADDHNYGLLTSVLEIGDDGKVWVVIGEHGTDEYNTTDLIKIHDKYVEPTATGGNVPAHTYRVPKS